MYIIITLVALLVVLAFWHWDLLGLSIFGLCGISFIRDPTHTLALPIIMLAAVVVFLVFGLFTIRYFNKHMPNSVGLRLKKYKENKILSYYVIGFSIYLIANLSINIVELLNCKDKDPNPTL
jgi:heme/copper-type cytochrome/quinol oxidase subunit 2